MKFLLLLLFPYFLSAQVDTSVHAPIKLRHYSTQNFLHEGLDLKCFNWNNRPSTLEINKAERQFRISKGLLGGGIASCVIGTGSLCMVALQSSSKNTITPQSTPYLITGLAFNLISMPACFVLREVILKKAVRHIQKAKQLTTQ